MNSSPLPPSAPTPATGPDHWYAETPILIEALAATVRTSIPDVCEHLEANVVEDHVSEVSAVLTFIDEYITA